MTTKVTRLHITPLTPELLPVILGLSTGSDNVSYHQIQTFPEKAYGYVELPAMEAEKIKKKLNGAILKGKKMTIEDAKPGKRKRTSEGANLEAEQPEAEPSKSTRKRKAREGDGVLPGHELSLNRTVKRGWTEAKKSKADQKSANKSDRPRSRYSDKEELLFRTKLPPNKLNENPDKQSKGKKKTSSKVVHEFEKSTAQPTFLKQSKGSAQGYLEYVEGQGWVDEKGAVVEPEPPNVKRRRQETKRVMEAPAMEASKRDSRVAETDKTAVQATESAEEQPEFDAGEDSTSEDEAETSSSSGTPSTPEAAENLKLKASKEPEVHPLEALFKKPQKPASSQDIAKPSLELATSNFSFFETADELDDVDDELSVPGTPYSSQDVRSRGLRSAAPTPDTAHPSRFNSYGSSSFHADEEDMSEKEDEQRPESSVRDTRSRSIPGKREPSDFEKMFWEKRGDNNRAWKARRRTVLKEKRQRENRTRRPKNW